VKKFLAALLFTWPFAAHAVDSLSFEYGAGSREVNLWRVGLQWKQEPAEWMAHHPAWSWYWDVALGGWHGDHGTVHDVSVTPVFRYAKAAQGPYLEGAIGFHILSDSHISTDLGFSTRFQFGNHLAAGYHHGKYDWQVRLQHLSNGGMRNPNPGINFLILRLQRNLD
jgi:lipid A 3-O-deacylase